MNVSKLSNCSSLFYCFEGHWSWKKSVAFSFVIALLGAGVTYWAGGQSAGVLASVTAPLFCLTLLILRCKKSQATLSIRQGERYDISRQEIIEAILKGQAVTWDGKPSSSDERWILPGLCLSNAPTQSREEEQHVIEVCLQFMGQRWGVYSRLPIPPYYLDGTAFSDHEEAFRQNREIHDRVSRALRDGKKVIFVKHANSAFSTVFQTGREIASNDGGLAMMGYLGYLVGQYFQRRLTADEVQKVKLFVENQIGCKYAKEIRWPVYDEITEAFIPLGYHPLR